MILPGCWFRQTFLCSLHRFSQQEAALSPAFIFLRMAGLFLFLLVMGNPGRAQQPTQPLQSFGYVGVADYLSAHPGARIAADWDYFGADPPPETPDATVDLTGKFQILQNNTGANGLPHPLKAYVDVSRVFFYQNTPTTFALRANYVDRWIQFRNAQGIYFQPDQIGNYVFALNVFNEPHFWGVPMSDVQRAAALLKCPLTPDPFNPNPDCRVVGGFPSIPTSVIEAGNQVADPNYIFFPLADYVDWYAADWYGVRPSRSSITTNSLNHLDTMMAALSHSQKKIVFAFDGFYESAIHSCVAKNTMGAITQEWFNVAGRHSDGISAGVLHLQDYLDANQNVVEQGSASLGLLEQQAHIWQAVHDGKLPAYEGHVENANCQTISGWAWDSNQSDASLLGTSGYGGTTAWLDLFADGKFFKSVPAQDFRQDLADAGKGSGRHGFSAPTPDYFRDGVSHTLSVRPSGSDVALPSDASLSCAVPSFSFTTELPYGQVGAPFQQSLWNGGNPSDYNFSVVAGQVPPGLTVDASGVLTGVPSAAGAFLIQLRAVEKTPATCDISPSSLYTFTRIFSVIIQCGGACPAQSEGTDDTSNPSEIAGWAWDRVQPDAAAQVDIYDNPADIVPNGAPLLARVTANLFRQDLLDAGKGNGNHGFVFPFPAALKDGNSHRIHVTFAGTKTELNLSPRVVIASSGRFDGSHATNTCSRIDGYALDTLQPNTPIDVDIFDGGSLLATLVANYDSSVVPATSGKGAHGFLFYTPDSLRDGNSHDINIRFRLSGQQLPHTDQTLTCPAAVPHLNPSWEGWLDNATCDRVDGWGWDATLPNTPIDMVILADGNLIATLTANYFSQDLFNAGKGNGIHRFLYYLPDFLKDGLQHLITVRIAGQGIDLPISSGITDGTIICSAVQPTVTVTGSGSSVYGQNVSLAAHVVGYAGSLVPQGTVAFFDGSQSLGTGTLDGFSQTTVSTALLSAGTRTITAYYSGNSVFPPGSAQTSQVVTPATLSVSVNPATRQYGAANPAFTGTLTGVQNGDNITATFQSAATATSPVGSYAITAVLSDPAGRLGNYTPPSQTGTLTVTAAPLVVTPNNKTRMYGNPNPALDGVITGLRNGDNIQAVYSTTATAVSLVGSYPITVASLTDPGAKLGNYSATLQSGTLTVTRSNIALAPPVFNPPGGVYTLGSTIAISDPTPATAAIHYTVDGTVPTAASPLYTGPVTFSAPFTLSAIAMQPEYQDSAVASAGYTNQIPVSVAPGTQEVSGCATTSYTVTVPAATGVSGTLALSVSGLPAGATASFSPASLTNAGSSTLTVHTSSTPKGTFTLTITVSNGTLSGTTAAILKNKVQQACP